jgi:hypothetical protein
MTYSPWDLLPAPEPKNVCYPLDYFYEFVAKHLIKDTVRIMNNGLHIDMDRVVELEQTLDNIIKQVHINLAHNNYVQMYLVQRHKSLVAKYRDERRTKLKSLTHFLKPFKPGDMTHRSYFMHIYAQNQGIEEPSELLPTGVPKWSANHVKKFAKSNPVLRKLLDKSISITHPIAQQAMELLAKHKQEHHNAQYEAQIQNPTIDLPAFNPASSVQINELFTMLGISSESTSKTTGNPSYNRKELERIHDESTDSVVIDLCKQLIDFSFAAIVRNNFIEAFYNYTVDSRLHGNLKLLGAKSARYTSNKPNLLNMPSTGSIFAKPIKRCFTAPEGFLIATADFAALEDRVVANLSRDDNKMGLFLEGLDGHSLSATYMLADKVRELIGPYTDNKQASKDLKALVDTNPDAKAVRQNVKPISFKLAYGGYPDVHKGGFITQEIFDAYHNELFPGITRFREEYVLPTAQSQGQIHLGLGFHIASDDPERDIRTLNNACSQFWSILTAITINKMHQLIDEAGLQDDIITTSTIYDSIYWEVRDDPEVIKWLNDNLIPVMTRDFMIGQLVHNDVDLEIGTSWASLTTLPHNADLDTVTDLITKAKES